MDDHIREVPHCAIPRDDLPPIVPIPNKRIKDLTGQTFGRLTAVGFVGTDNRGQARWLCHCACGEINVVAGRMLSRGKTKSCGCYLRETRGDWRRTHGSSRTREYGVWRGMIDRCENPSVASYKDYGERGITVDARWRNSFECFCEDMGPKPGPHYTIERIDNDLGYTPDNCRWATKMEQANNTRANHLLEYQDERLTLAQWSRRTGFHQDIIYGRLARGWSTERTLTTPVRKY